MVIRVTVHVVAVLVIEMSRRVVRDHVVMAVRVPPLERRPVRRGRVIDLVVMHRRAVIDGTGVAVTAFTVTALVAVTILVAGAALVAVAARLSITTREGGRVTVGL